MNGEAGYPSCFDIETIFLPFSVPFPSHASAFAPARGNDAVRQRPVVLSVPDEMAAAGAV
jgi:hypothetical protein